MRWPSVSSISTALLRFCTKRNCSTVSRDLDELVATVAAEPGPLNVVIMSNGGFGGVHDKLLAALRGRSA